MTKNFELIEDIEKIRKVMEISAFETGFTSKDTVKASQKLDNLLNELGIVERKHSSEPFHVDIGKINSVINNEASILLTNLEGTILYANSKCCQMIGYNKDEIIGKHTRIFNSRYHTKEYFKKMWNTILSGQIWKNEINIKRKDNSTAWNMMSIFPILDDNNQPYQFLTLRTDITEKKEMEFAAAQKERQLSSLITNAVEVIGIINEEWNIIYQNNAIEKVIGYKAEEVLGTNIFNYLLNFRTNKVGDPR
ncbi:PAS domain S-box protein [Anaerobacillus isosaccharinicus]|uniref:PAS domain S-box protein n=1 Tax=Anaerobacillus isosaccharinicus TaxID=1532552 RepID=A0A1S2KZD4_9BACI|nr:PAS domain S-box protein [Anaerobacillus isosaccharinicus]MBA5584972.1 PAS domain S-box protein [Anaerobacillus isosaccharinicus]QOY36674.1 PAS domain S-box protein [Anaerobacillus isosaccharinicus]